MFLLEDKRFYVYIYLDPREKGNYEYSINDKKLIFDYKPFYVGKGLNNRINEHIFEAKRIKSKKYKHLKILEILNKNLIPITLKLKENLTDIDACIFEKNLIKIIGRLNNNTGPLSNLIKGGSGGSSRFVSKKDKWREKIKEYYSNNINRKKAGYYSTKEYYINKYGLEEGSKKYILRIEKIKATINETYKNIELRNKCKNFGIKNGFYGKKSKSAVKIKINEEYFDSIFDASVKLNIPYTTLSQRLKNKKNGYEIIP